MGRRGGTRGEGAESGANASLHLNINKHGVPSKMPRELLLPMLLQLRDFHESSQSATPLLARGEANRKGVAIATERALLLNFGRNAAESCNQLAAFLLPPSRSRSSLSLSLSSTLSACAQAAFCGRTFWPVGGCPFLPFLAIYPGQPGTRVAIHAVIHSLTHSLPLSFTHSLHSHYFVACVMS